MHSQIATTKNLIAASHQVSSDKPDDHVIAISSSAFKADSTHGGFPESPYPLKCEVGMPDSSQHPPSACHIKPSASSRVGARYGSLASDTRIAKPSFVHVARGINVAKIYHHWFPQGLSHTVEVERAESIPFSDNHER
jgi:hypothetical protein